MNDLNSLLKRVQYEILSSTTEAGSGHPTSSLSAAQLMTVLLFDGHFNYNWDNPKYIFNDRLVFSKGHAAPLLYALYAAAGVSTHEELMTLRKIDSDYEGHPTPRLPWVDVATGSLGQGLSVGVGMALGIKRQIQRLEEPEKNAKDERRREISSTMQRRSHDTVGTSTATEIRNFSSSEARSKAILQRQPQVYVLMGDSEFAEGQIYEALQLASHYKLNNLVGILDVNRLGQRGATMLGWDLQTYEERVESFGWNTIVIENGNDLEEVKIAFENLVSKDRPTMIIARTKKGAGISFLEDQDNWHGKALDKEQLKMALEQLGDVDTSITGEVGAPFTVVIQGEKRTKNPNHVKEKTERIIKELDTTVSMATREAYGEAMKLLVTDENVAILDAETSNSTYAEKMKSLDPEKFYEMYIAEQNMISVALGMNKVGLKPYASSFAAFLSRAFDQIRMAQYSDPNVVIVGSHAGVSIGEDGSSQMALEDLTMMRSLLHSTVLYPSDPISTLKLVGEAHKAEGIRYLRLTRAKTDTLYSVDDEFTIGGSKLLRSSEHDEAVVVAAGITVHEALKAYELLKKKGIYIAVVDAYSVKPLDAKTILEQAEKTAKVIVVEDHYPYGGLGDAVREVLLQSDGLKLRNSGISSTMQRRSQDSVETSTATEHSRFMTNNVNIEFHHLCVNKIPRSGKPEELLAWEGIDAEAIVKVVTDSER